MEMTRSRSVGSPTTPTTATCGSRYDNKATQDFMGVTSIYGVGGLGSNSITIDPDVNLPTVLYGGFDPLTDIPNAVANYSDRNVTDTITAGAGPTDITGGPGTNYLHAGTGDATIYGEWGDELHLRWSGRQHAGGRRHGHTQWRSGDELPLRRLRY